MLQSPVYRDGSIGFPPNSDGEDRYSPTVWLIRHVQRIPFSLVLRFGKSCRLWPMRQTARDSDGDTSVEPLLLPIGDQASLEKCFAATRRVNAIRS